MTSGAHMLNIAQAGLAFADSAITDNKLILLLDIENILDKGRGNATADERKLINEMMDQLRGTIREMLDAMPSDEAKEFMMYRGRDAQNRFTIKI